ncbi:MAG: GntR family transcriptional regulator [Bacillota bacterium]|uniref:GntR family transcriptional regulator n=1 Tax=Bacillus infantis TaxID=324767 RepID=UPI003982AB90
MTVVNGVKGNSVYDHLSNAIRSGVIKAGQTLTERGLAQQLGVSRTPIREAFRKLEEHGLVKYEPHKGVKVITLSLERVIHLYQVRELLEGLAVRTLTELNDQEAIGELSAYIESAEKEAAVNNIKEMSIINTKFHLALARLSGNGYLEDIMYMLQTHISLMMSTSLSHTGRPVENIEEHKMIINAIQSKDADLAENVAKYHVRQARDHALKMIEMDGWNNDGN